MKAVKPAKPKEAIPRVYIRSALRRLWMWGDARRQAIKNARIKAPSMRGYLCRQCGAIIPKLSEVAVDHIVDVGPTPGSRNGKDANWHDLITRLFCPASGLQVLCVRCHDSKTHGTNVA